MSCTDETKVFVHGGSTGDTVYSLAVIKAMGGGKLYLTHLKQGALLKPLLEIQPYLTEVICSKTVPPNTLNLNMFRHYALKALAEKRVEHLILSHFKALGINKIPNPSEPWLVVKNFHQCKFPILVNRTGRYPGELAWNVLSDFKNKVAFIGLEDEHKNFNKRFNLDIPWIQTNNALEIAMLIADCKLFIGNQSLCYAIAEGLKKRRILEVSKKAPNCMPIDDSASIILTSKLVEEIINAN